MSPEEMDPPNPATSATEDQSLTTIREATLSIDSA